MNNISPERKVAIAFIRVFRSNLDETIRPSSLPLNSSYADQSIRILFGNLTSPPADVVSALRMLFNEINIDLLNHLDQIYDSILPDTISSAMNDLEIWFRQSFTENELNSLAEVIANEAVMKLLSKSEPFEILKRAKSSLYDMLDARVTEFSNSLEIRERISEAVKGFIKNPKLDDNHPEDEGPLDPKNIF